MIDAFSNLHGNPNGNKNTVIKDVKWELTGRVNIKYAAPGASWPVSSAVSSAKPTTSKITTSSQSPSSTQGGTCTGCLGAHCDGKTTVCNDGLTCLAPDGVCSNAACNWGQVGTHSRRAITSQLADDFHSCKGWSCDTSTPCQKPSSCVNGVCTAVSSSGTCNGCVGSTCDGRSTVCNTGLTCISPDGICKDAECNWG